MGFHVCEYCGWDPQPKPLFSHLSSGDVTLVFDFGRMWEMPDMILHYVADHNWQPPAEFIDDVMNHNLVAGQRAQTKSPTRPTRIAYLSGPFRTGPVPAGFVEKLESLMKQVAEMGKRVQYRGFEPGVTGHAQYMGIRK